MSIRDPRDIHMADQSEELINFVNSYRPAQTTDRAVYNFIETLPPTDEIRRILNQNIRNGRMLRKILRIAKDRDSVNEAGSLETDN